MNEQPPSLPGNFDIEHLRLLSIFHYVIGGLKCLGFCAGGMYACFGFMLAMIPHKIGEPSPIFFGAFFALLGLLIGLVSLTLGILTIISGRLMRKRRCRIFSIVIGAINCMSLPFGTVLGIFTLIVLMRDSVRRLYDEAAKPA